MKILSLYVENFGGLRQLSLSLTDGMNTLLKPNGWGKSSLAVFIKAMLYGLPASTRRSLLENERKRYTPWQGGVYGGSMDVCVNGQNVRIERTFGDKEAQDTLTLSDPVTGAELPLPVGSSLGEAWFGLDAAAYERSTYLSAREIDGKDGDLSIHAKLNRLMDATDDINSFDRAMDVLEKQRKYYTVSGGRRGAIADDEEQLAQLIAQIEACRGHLSAASAEETQLEQLLAALQQCKKESEALHICEQEQMKRGERLAKLQTLRRMLAQLAATEAERDGLLSSIGGQLPEEETLRELAMQEEQLAAAQAREQQLLARCAPEHPQQRELAELLALFGENAPDPEEITQLRAVAEHAKTAKLQWQSEQAKESTLSDATGQEERIVPFPDARRLQRFLTQYPMQKQQSDGRTRELERECREGAQRVAQLRIRGEKKKKCIWLVAAIGLVLGIVALLLHPLVGAAVLAVGVCATVACVTLWRREVAGCRETQDALARVMQERAAHQKETEQLQAEWLAARTRIRTVLGVEVNDIETAQSALDDYEERSARASVLERERETARGAWYERIAARRKEMEEARGRLQQLWAWGECPITEDAPIEVERLSQKAARMVQLQAELAAVQREEEQLQSLLLSLREQRQTLLRGCVGVPQIGAESWLRERGEQAARLQVSCEQQKQEIAEFTQQTGLHPDEIGENVESVSVEEREALQAQRETIDEQESALHGQIARCRREIEIHTAQSASLEHLEHEAEELRVRIEQQKASLDAVLLTQKYMKQAKEQLSGRYLTQMKQSFARYFAALTDEQEAAFTMDGSFAVKLRRAGVSRAHEAFSTGQRDVIALCARLALVDALFEGEAPFLVLDDPFTNLDDRTVDRAAALLTAAAKRYQILYLTCHSSREALCRTADQT